MGRLDAHLIADARADAPGSAVHRALARLALTSHDHPANLAKQAKLRLNERDGEAGWLLAERLARLRFELVADDLMLRALALIASKDASAAWRDIRGALKINPLHPIANRLSLASPDPNEREQAAQRLLQSDPEPPILRDALRILMSGDVQAVGAFSCAPDSIRGWIVWAGDPVLACRMTCDNGSNVHTVTAQAEHKFALDFANATFVEWAWPATADWVALTCESRRGLFQPDRLWRPAVAKPIQPADFSDISGAAPEKVAVVVPVYDDIDATRSCFDALLAHPERSLARRIIAIDDATPDPRIAALLDELARNAQIELLRNRVNLGFAASVNRALKTLAIDEDAVLLNADTIAPPEMCARLARVAYSRGDIATVTPLSNNGEYTSAPIRFLENPLPSLETLLELDRLAASLQEDEAVELPNGVGFCLYVKRSVLAAIGLLPSQFGRGYYEDVEFCLRAREAGFRHVCASGVFVGHAGSRSFKDEKRALVVSNLLQIDQLRPDYRRLSVAFVREDPLRALIGKLEWEWLLARRDPVALIVCGAERSEALIARYADGRGASEADVIVVTLNVGPNDFSIHLRSRTGKIPQNVSISYRAKRFPLGPVRDLARLPIARLAIVDPGNLPTGFIRALMKSNENYDVLLSDSCIFDARSTTTLQKEQGKATNLGRPELSPTVKRILSAAVGIFPSTERFSRLLAARLPSVAAKLRVLPHEGELDPAAPPVSKARSRQLLIIGDDSSAAVTRLVESLAAEFRRANVESSLIVDGALADDLRAMARGNVFVLGSGGALRDALRHAEVGAVLFPSRRWSMGDVRVDEATALGVPVALFDYSTDDSRVSGQDLLLSPTEALLTTVSALMEWWRNLGRLASPGA